jgi:hypothetical protein
MRDPQFATGGASRNLSRTRHGDDVRRLTICVRCSDDRLDRRDLAARHQPLDMEPFEVVRDMLRDPGHAETIGGAPQVVKVYQYMRTAPLGVYWPQKAGGEVYLQGRACLGYERIDRWVLDPDTLVSERQVVQGTVAVPLIEEDNREGI